MTGARRASKARARFVRTTAPTVLLDTNVLLPEYLRTVFLDLADAGLLAPHWSQDILSEFRRNLVSDKFGVDPGKADGLLKMMNEAFPDALVRGYAKHKARFASSVDEKDVHVAAAAYKLSLGRYGGTSVVLVTANQKHLPRKAFEGTVVETSRPGRFLAELLREDPKIVADTLRATCQRLKRPSISQEDLLIILERNNCKAFAEQLAGAWEYVAS
jgi:PIN domain